jgi:hydrogenase expression/formation protein HypE
MAASARAVGVSVVTGDTKVVARGAADKIFITTSGVGIVPEGVHLSSSFGRPGDRVLVSGPLGEHGVTILAARAGLDIAVSCRSDTAPLAGLVVDMLDAYRGIHSLRDPTRGGLAATLNELAEQSKVSIEIDEERLPVSEGVENACELLGLDPLHLANEGVLVALVPEEGVDRVLEVMHRRPIASAARVVGTVVSGTRGVTMRTRIGGRRMISMPSGVPLPRIC